MTYNCILWQLLPYFVLNNVLRFLRERQVEQDTFLKPTPMNIPKTLFLCGLLEGNFTHNRS